MPLLTQRDWSSTWAKRTLPPICAVGKLAGWSPLGEPNW
jgi:hypothetical protein